MRLDILRRIYALYGQIVIGFVIALIIFYLWSYADIQIFGHLALSRLNEHWPTLVQVSVPIILFSVVLVFPTCLLLTRLPFFIAKSTMISLTILFSVIGIYIRIEMKSNGLDWVIFLVQLLIVAASAFIAWELLKTRKRVGLP
jgi:hypothetical protein